MTSARPAESFVRGETERSSRGCESTVSMIQKAIELTNFRWRTATGIYQYLKQYYNKNISFEELDKVLRTDKRFIVASVTTPGDHRALYSTRKIYDKTTNPFRKLLDFLSNKVTI